MNLEGKKNLIHEKAVNSSNAELIAIYKDLHNHLSRARYWIRAINTGISPDCICYIYSIRNKLQNKLIIRKQN